MKKFYVLMVMVLFSGFLFAQSLNQIGGVRIMNPDKVVKPKAALNHVNASQINLKQPKSTSYDYRWYNYAGTMQTINFPSGPPENNLYGDFLFPDTTVVLHYSNGNFRPGMHSIAVVLDPYDSIFYDATQSVNMMLVRVNDTLKRNYSYTIDSVGFSYLYIRTTTDAAEKDTLEVEFITNLDGLIYEFTGAIAHGWSYDTTTFCGLFTDNNMNYTFNTDTLTKYHVSIPSVQTVKIPLGTVDSSLMHTDGSAYIKTKYIAPKTALGYGKHLCAATFRFIPGYQWSANQDTLNATYPQNNDNLNYFEFLAYMENGVGETAQPRYDPYFYNESEFFTTQSLAGGWKNTYIPRLAYSLGQIDNIVVSFGLKVQVINPGITQNTEKNISLSQNMPNPAGNSTIIPYTLQGTNNVTLVITDLTGKQVMEINEGKQMAGSHTISLNTDNLSSGMYFYTLNADNTKLTRKMIVNK